MQGFPVLARQLFKSPHRIGDEDYAPAFPAHRRMDAVMVEKNRASANVQQFTSKLTSPCRKELKGKTRFGSDSKL